MIFNYCRYKKISSLFIGILLLASCSTYHRIKSIGVVNKATVSQTSFLESINYELVQALPVFFVQIDGKQYRFIVDTGGYTVLSEKIMKEVKGIKKVSYFDIKDGNNESDKIGTYILDKITIGGIPFTDVGFAKIGFTEAEWFSCLGIDGTIGPNILKECIWFYDNDNLRIVLTDRIDKVNFDASLTIPIKTNNINKPIIDYSIGNYSGNLTFDTGYNGFLNFYNPTKNLVFENFPRIEKIGHTSNAGNSIEKRKIEILKIDIVNVNGLLFTNTLATLDNYSSSDILGSRIFEVYNVAFDLASDKVHFQQRSEGIIENNLNSFGFGFEFSNHTIQIGYIYKESPASKAGIEVGDKVVSVNGTTYAFDSYCDFMERFEIASHDVIELELKRNQRIFRVSLKKEKLFSFMGCFHPINEQQHL
ncbi:MAG: hypothetical protein HC811_11025 [Flammeovirgaceae bacterium]|nr:hypothetical protein [Flammeovirgaceae bacterium]